MKVCMVIGSLRSGGAERVATTLANHWATAGWRVAIITLSDVDADFYGVDTAVRRTGLALETNNFNAFRGMWNNLTRVSALRRVLRQNRPDIALGFMPSCNILTGLACFGTGIIAIGSEHIHPPMMPLENHWRYLRRLVYPRLTAVTALTEASRCWIRNYTRASHVPVIPNPVSYPLPEDARQKEVATLGPTTDGHKHLLAVGRLTEQKGFDRLLDAFASVHERHPEWRLTILGEGPLRPALENQCARLGLNDSVAMPGAVANIGARYESADLYVMTSRYEGFGNTLAEALAYGLPAIAMDCPTGPRDIVRHEVDGLLVPQDDQNALVAALDRLMSNAGERARFAARAVEARERFATKRTARQWEELFAELMDKKNRRA